MKINKRKSNKKIITIITSSMIILAVLYCTVAYFNDLFPFNSDKATNEQKDAGEDQKKSTAVPADGKDTTPKGNTSTDGIIAVDFTSFNQSTEQIQIRSLIEAVSNSGSCTLTMVKDGVTVTKTSGIQAGPTTSTCEGFNISIGELSPGDWQTTLSVEIGTRKGSATKTYKVQ
ncbi:hypothetical protein COV88_00385 [Candidatus Saccharibacteria bacterium CG11_big_fil_rev_8_21_14_0_20_41_19]|nr:hypothetical protein [Candidatus Saccharibacteria bacterium]OIP85461.1 MAG: hypothetical protein AUK57_04060 [Candidatus Saccharibacteria bacterium CG2_30_41_52]PIQ71240.1 MAG: hypothetical protein COV88_00385 [Candidatus Saccharibacteria bacterium CG11_big_fil_rev_8_21_14_0_20_41_19]PIZ59813.1 MAG: hypothetical protein COY18_02490 [Candidatus Saccharibacteria bacterium CG_4_10_14_0_2_um_filter_41_11]PJC29843.1 MAG: hypothetical protein CO052_01100 [Candidatus Saccharibacteria bacterium CG_4